MCRNARQHSIWHQLMTKCLAAVYGRRSAAVSVLPGSPGHAVLVSQKVTHRGSPRESRSRRFAAPSGLRRARMSLQQSMRFVQLLDTAKVLPTPMITGDCDILDRSRHSEPYLTKSEVRLRWLKITRRLDNQGLRRVPASPECAGSRYTQPSRPKPSHPPKRGKEIAECPGTRQGNTP